MKLLAPQSKRSPTSFLAAFIAATLLASCGGSESAVPDHGVEQTKPGLTALDEAEALSQSLARLSASLRLLADGEQLARVRAAAGATIADLERAQARLTELEVGSSSSIGLVAEAAEAERSLAERLRRLAGVVNAGESALDAEGDDASQRAVKEALRDLGEPQAEAQAIIGLLEQSEKALLAALAATEKELRHADALSGALAARITEVRDRLQDGKDASTPGLDSRLDALRSRLKERQAELEAPPLTTGPAQCGANAAGALVVINAGALACSDALFVSENSSGAELGSGPPGWNCGLTAITIEGVEVDGASGYGCENEAGVRISVHDPNPTPIPQTPSTEQECPPGEDFINGRCIVIETGGEEAGP